MTSLVAPLFQDHTHDVVSGHNDTDKTPMYEMPLTFVFGVWVLGLGRAFICIGLLSLAFCPRSQDVSEGSRQFTVELKYSDNIICYHWLRMLWELKNSTLWHTVIYPIISDTHGPFLYNHAFHILIAIWQWCNLMKLS